MPVIKVNGKRTESGKNGPEAFFLFLIRGLLGFPGGTSGKEPTCYLGNIRDASLTPGLGGSPG